MDIDKIIGKEKLISEHEKASHILTTNDEKAGASIFIFQKLKNASEDRSLYQGLKPLIEQLKLDIQGQGLELNEYGVATIEKNLNDATEFFRSRQDLRCDAIVLVGSIEKWTPPSPLKHPAEVMYVFTGNICKIKELGEACFYVSELETISVLTVPLSKCLFMDRVGAHISANEIFENMRSNAPDASD